MERFRAFIVLIVVISIMFLIGGFIVILFGYWNKDSFLAIASILGGVASVLSLLGFTIPSIKENDLEKLGLQYMKDVVEAGEILQSKKEELVSKDFELSEKEKEIDLLSIKKKEMEILVKKASLSLFLQDQNIRNTESLNKIIEENTELKRLLTEREPLIKKLASLQSEIDTDPNVEILEEIFMSYNIEKEKLEVPTFVEIIHFIGEEIFDSIKPLFFVTIQGLKSNFHVETI